MLGLRAALFVLLFPAVLVGEGARAGEFRDLYRGARQTAMGGAHVGLADDEQTMWLNPAGLTNLDGSSFHYLPAFIDVANDTWTAYANNLSTLSNFTPASIGNFIGYNIYGRVQATPSFVSPNFAVGAIVDLQGGMYSKNQVLPEVTMAYQITHGIAVSAAYAFSKSRPRKNDHKFAIGATAKLLFRKGGYKSVPLVTLMSQTNLYTYLDQLAGNYGMGVGMDFGAHYNIPLGKTSAISFGTSFQNAVPTSFSVSTADPLQPNWTAGMAFKNTNRSLDFILTWDMANLDVAGDWRLKSHFGIEIGLPFMRIFAGVNQVYPTAGVILDIWIAKLTLATYAQELGSVAGQDANRRWVIGFDAKF